MLVMDGEPVEGSKRRVWMDVNRSVSYTGAAARVGVVAMEENSAWKAVRVGTVKVAHKRGSASMWARRGSTERAGRESMREATKEAGARAVASGREMPPAVAGRRSLEGGEAGVVGEEYGGVEAEDGGNGANGNGVGGDGEGGGVWGIRRWCGGEGGRGEAEVVVERDLGAQAEDDNEEGAVGVDARDGGEVEEAGAVGGG